MTSYFHGGFGGLQPGELLLPPDMTGVESAVSTRTLATQYGLLTEEENEIRSDRVFVTDSVAAAMMYASLHPSQRGAVYEVSPEHPLEDDPDVVVGPKEAELGSWQCRFAVVLRVVCRPPPMPLDLIQKLMEDE